MTTFNLKIVQAWISPELPLLEIDVDKIPFGSALVSARCKAEVAGIDEETDPMKLNARISTLRTNHWYRAIFLRPSNYNQIIVHIYTN